MIKNIAQHLGQKERKSRAKYACPPELEELIYQVNLIPPNFQLKSLKWVYEDLSVELRKKNPDININPPIHEILELCLKGTPEIFQKHIESVAYNRFFPFGDNFEDPDITAKSFNLQYEMAKIYSDYFDMWTSMLWLLQRLETERQLKGELPYEHFNLLDWDAFPLSISTVIKRNGDGKLHITGLATLIGKFDDNRLRRCEVCQRIYWAKRDDSKTCSGRCLNQLNVRKSRSLTHEEKESKKLQREANSNLIKSGKAKPEKRKPVNKQTK